MHKWLRHLIYVFFMMLICIMPKNTYATTYGSASKPIYFNAKQSLYVPLPKAGMSYDNNVLTFKGIIIRRYQPRNPNSKTDSDYQTPVDISSKNGWFIPVSQATGDNFILNRNNPNLRNLLFSTYWDTKNKILGGTHNNLLINNQQFKFTVNYVFQLPNGLEVGDTIILNGEIITNDLGLSNIIYTRFAPVITQIDFPQGVATKYTLDEKENRTNKNDYIEITCHFSSPVRYIGTPTLDLVGLQGGNETPFLAKVNSGNGKTITYRYYLEDNKSYTNVKAISINSSQGSIFDIEDTTNTPIDFDPLDTSKRKLNIDHEQPLEFDVLTVGNYALGGFYNKLTPLEDYKIYMNDLLNPKIKCYDNHSGISSVRYTVLRTSDSKIYEKKTVKGEQLPIVVDNNLLPFYKNKVEFVPQLNIKNNIYNGVEDNITLYIEAVDTTGHNYFKNLEYMIDRKPPEPINIDSDLVLMQSLQDVLYKVQDTGVGVYKVQYKFNPTRQFDIIGASEAELLPDDDNATKLGKQIAHFVVNPNNFNWISYRIIDKLGNIRDGVLLLDPTKPSPPLITAKYINSGKDYSLKHVQWSKEPLRAFIYSGQNNDSTYKYNGGIKYTYWRINDGAWNKHEFNPVIHNKAELVTTVDFTETKTYHIEAYSEDDIGKKSSIIHYSLKINLDNKPTPKPNPPNHTDNQDVLDKNHYIYLNNSNDYKLTTHSITNEKTNKKLEIPINHTENEISFRGIKLSNNDIAIISTNAVNIVGIITDSDLNIKSYIKIPEKTTNPTDLIEYYRTLYIGFGGEGYSYIQLKDYKDIKHQLTPPINSFTVAQNHLYFNSTGVTPLYIYNFYKDALNLLRNHNGYDMFGDSDNTSCKSTYYLNNHYLIYPKYTTNSVAYHVIVTTK